MGAMYSCPVCKAQNHEHMKYCYKCGTWLQSSAFPAKRIGGSKPAGRKIGVAALIIVALLIIGVYRWDNALTFDRLEIGDEYVMTQLVVSRPLLREPTVAVDFTTLKGSEMPLEVQTVFYDDVDKRIGVASGEVGPGMRANETTTLELTFDSISNVRDIASVRVEIKPMGLLDLLERTTKHLEQFNR